MSIPIYAGPGKVFVNAVSLFPEGENGQIKLGMPEDTAEIASAMHGRIGEQARDQLVDITCKPFDSWGLLTTLFPVVIGATTGANTGALVVGTRVHGATNSATKVWTWDGRLYNVVRSAVVGHPSLHLGVGVPLFGDARISGIGDSVTPVAMGASGYLIAGNAITESGASDPGGAMAMSDFVRGAWTGVWGTVAGFGGAASSSGGTNAVQAESEWTVTSEVRYDSLKVQGRTIGMKLASARFMASCRPYGPSHTDIIAAIGAHTQGQRLGSADLVLTGPSSKTITIKNAEIKGAGFDFGGTTLGTGEVGFVNLMTFSAGAPQPLIIFSA